jgi:hypothetical protein
MDDGYNSRDRLGVHVERSNVDVNVLLYRSKEWKPYVDPFLPPLVVVPWAIFIVWYFVCKVPR